MMRLITLQGVIRRAADAAFTIHKETSKGKSKQGQRKQKAGAIAGLHIHTKAQAPLQPLSCTHGMYPMQGDLASSPICERVCFPALRAYTCAG
jgi:hypothetical protein